MCPFEQRIAFAVPFIFLCHIVKQTIPAPVSVNLDGMIDDQFHGYQRIDRGGIASQVFDCVAHGGEIDDCGDAGEILHQYAGRMIGNLNWDLIGFLPIGDGCNIFRFHSVMIEFSEEIFNENPDRERQPADRAQAFFLEFPDIEIRIVFPLALNVADEFCPLHGDDSFCRGFGGLLLSSIRFLRLPEREGGMHWVFLQECILDYTPA